MSDKKISAVCGFTKKDEQGEDIPYDDYVVGFALHNKDRSNPLQNLKFICREGNVMNSDGTFMEVQGAECKEGQVKRLKLSKEDGSTVAKYVCVNPDQKDQNTFPMCPHKEDKVIQYENGLEYCWFKDSDKKPLSITFDGNPINKDKLVNVYKCENPVNSDKKFKMGGIEFENMDSQAGKIKNLFCIPE